MTQGTPLVAFGVGGEMGQLSAAIYWIVARVRADGRRRGCRDHCTGVKSSKAGPRLGPKTKGR